MKDFINNYWQEGLFLWLASIISISFGYIFKKLKRLIFKQKKIEAGVLAILHNELFQACKFYEKQGWCSLEERENIAYMFEPYKGLEGNGTCEKAYNKLCELPYENPNPLKEVQPIRKSKAAITREG